MSDEPGHELIRMIEEADWEKLTPNLLGFAQFCLSRHRMRAGPAGETSHDYVTRSVYELLEGKHSHLQGSLFRRLCLIISGMIRQDAAGTGGGVMERCSGLDLRG